MNGVQDPGAERILVGVFDKKSIKGLSEKLTVLATIKMETDADGAISVFAQPKKGGSVDSALKALWKNGYADAFVVR
jgi:hypothetical protein